MKLKSHKILLTLIMLLLRIILTMYLYFKIYNTINAIFYGLKYIDSHCRQLHYNPLDYRHLYTTKVSIQLIV